MNLSDRIAINPEICHGKPTIRGLRYTVETILELLSLEWMTRFWLIMRISKEKTFSRRWTMPNDNHKPH